jgi:hypothetical protein
MRILVIILAILLLLLLVGWLGLRVQPRPFADPADAGFEGEMPAFAPLPAGLPAPVERFYRTLYGEGAPLISSAILDGRGTIRFAGLTLPARWRFVHEFGTGYRHYIEATWFGLPIMHVDEAYLNGRSSFRLPVMGEVEDSEKLQQAANLGMWSEALWFPSRWLNDPRVRWSAVNDQTALLTVPFDPATGPSTEETFVVRFDPETGLLTWMESMRYRDTDSPAKTLWMNHAPAWHEVDGWLQPVVGEVTWMDEGTPWASFRIESATFNADVGDYIGERGL